MSALSDFRVNLADKFYCSLDLSRLIVRKNANAANYPYIQHNHANKINWLVFDVDRGSESALSYQEADLPDPNIIVKNPQNSNCHLFYRLKQPVWTHAAAGTKAQNYYKAIKNGLTKQIGADDNYCGLICKNPLHGQWQTTEIHSGQFELVTFGDCLKSTWKSQAVTMRKESEAANEVFGRNCSVFESLRFYAYDNVSSYKQLADNVGIRAYEMWLNTLIDAAVGFNSHFNESLPYSEIRTIAKSVAKWTWSNYNPSERKRRGIMGFGETRHNFNFNVPMLDKDEIKRRQSLSAELTNKHRKENTELMIKQAIERLNANGEKVTKAAVAKATGLARSKIIANYSHLFPEKVSPTVGIR